MFCHSIEPTTIICLVAPHDILYTTSQSRAKVMTNVLCSLNGRRKPLRPWKYGINIWHLKFTIIITIHNVSLLRNVMLNDKNLKLCRKKNDPTYNQLIYLWLLNSISLSDVVLCSDHSPAHWPDIQPPSHISFSFATSCRPAFPSLPSASACQIHHLPINAVFCDVHLHSQVQTWDSHQHYLMTTSNCKINSFDYIVHTSFLYTYCCKCMTF